MQGHQPSRKQQSHTPPPPPPPPPALQPLCPRPWYRACSEPVFESGTDANLSSRGDSGDSRSWWNICADLKTLHYGRPHRLLKSPSQAVSVWVVYLRTEVLSNLDLSGSSDTTDSTMTHMALEVKEVITWAWLVCLACSCVTVLKATI